MAESKGKTVVSAFTEDQVMRLTGLSLKQLRHWDRTGFFVPSLADEDRSKPYSRLYSFKDLVCLKLLNSLRNEHGVSMQHLRGVKQKLSHLGEDLWSKTKLYVLKKRVVFDNPETKAKEEVLSGQGVLQIALEVVTGDMKAAVTKIRTRDEGKVGKVEAMRSAGNTRAVIAGTTIPVDAIKAFHHEGYSIEEIQEEYPRLTLDDIRAAIAHEDAA